MEEAKLKCDFHISNLKIENENLVLPKKDKMKEKDMKNLIKIE